MDPELKLLSEFVGNFSLLDDELRSPSEQENSSPSFIQPTQHTHKWRPIEFRTDPICLKEAEAFFPGPFPDLFGKMLLNYRWPEVNLKLLRLLPNPRGMDLTGFLDEVRRDKYLYQLLYDRGLTQFAKGPELSYDPICFITSSASGFELESVVQVSHESLLCQQKLEITKKIAVSFSELIKIINTVALDPQD